jgi:hypothetical protein
MGEDSGAAVSVPGRGVAAGEPSLSPPRTAMGPSGSGSVRPGSGSSAGAFGLSSGADAGLADCGGATASSDGVRLRWDSGDGGAAGVFGRAGAPAGGGSSSGAPATGTVKRGTASPLAGIVGL